MEQIATSGLRPEPWNKGKLVGEKSPLKRKDIWAIRIRLQIAHRVRELALFDLAIDSKLRACDLVRLRVRDVAHGERVAARAIVMQQKTQRPVRFEITEQTREAVANWIGRARLKPEDYLFPSRLHQSPRLSTRQYARIVDRVREIGLNPGAYGTRSLRRTKASLILPADEEPPSRAVASRSHEAGEHRAVPGDLRWTTRWRWLSRPRSRPVRRGSDHPTRWSLTGPKRTSVADQNRRKQAGPRVHICSQEPSLDPSSRKGFNREARSGGGAYGDRPAVA
jgi:integrase